MGGTFLRGKGFSFGKAGAQNRGLRTEAARPWTSACRSLPRSFGPLGQFRPSAPSAAPGAVPRNFTSENGEQGGAGGVTVRA
jgi:hypothetical protein